MAFRFKILTANAGLDALTALFPATAIFNIYKDTIPTDADTAVGAQTLLASIILPSSPWAAASARSAAKSGTWQDSSADGGAADAPTWFRLKNAADTHRIDGTIGVGSGDVSADGSITAGQVVTVTAFSITG
jgi:hypothetical protein